MIEWTDGWMDRRRRHTFNVRNVTMHFYLLSLCFRPYEHNTTFSLLSLFLYNFFLSFCSLILFHVFQHSSFCLFLLYTHYYFLIVLICLLFFCLFSVCLCCLFLPFRHDFFLLFTIFLFLNFGNGDWLVSFFVLQWLWVPITLQMLSKLNKNVVQRVTNKKLIHILSFFFSYFLRPNFYYFFFLYLFLLFYLSFFL